MEPDTSSKQKPILSQFSHTPVRKICFNNPTLPSISQASQVVFIHEAFQIKHLYSCFPVSDVHLTRITHTI